jgi:DNA-cytosine methyltransferase
MNVLSLFDGMSAGQIALNRAGIKYENYFASEIDKYAIQVTQHNYPNTKQIGSVVDVKAEDLPKIDLLIGGSPCQSFSFAGKMKGMSTKDNQEILSLEHYLELKNKGFEFEGQSYLFWEYVRILKQVKPKYFLLENVMMQQKWKDVITETLGVKPVMINSNLVSAQNRKRLYWTNIIDKIDIVDKNIQLSDILENNVFDKEPYDEKFRSNKPINYKSSKFNTLRAFAGSKTRGVGICNDNGWWRKLTPLECERLQTVSDNYTSIVSNSQRYKMLGNGWTVDVIVEFFKNIK